MFKELFVESSEYEKYKKAVKNPRDISELEKYAKKIKDKKQFLKDLAIDNNLELDVSKSDKDINKVTIIKDAIGLK